MYPDVSRKHVGVLERMALRRAARTLLDAKKIGISADYLYGITFKLQFGMLKRYVKVDVRAFLVNPFDAFFNVFDIGHNSPFAALLHINYTIKIKIFRARNFEFFRYD